MAYRAHFDEHADFLPRTPHESGRGNSVTRVELHISQETPSVDLKQQEVVRMRLVCVPSLLGS